MKKQKIVMYFTETSFHKVEIELEEDEMNSLVEDLDDESDVLGADDLAGEFCSSSTLQNSEWEMEDYVVIDQ